MSGFSDWCRASLLGRASASGNIDVQSVVGGWPLDPGWRAQAAALLPAERRARLAELGREIYDRDLGHYQRELRWNTARVHADLWSADELGAILREHTAQLLSAAADAYGFTVEEERRALVAGVELSGLERLAAARSSGRGVMFISVYQAHPRFLFDHPAVGSLRVGVVRHGDGVSTLLDGSPGNVEVLPASSVAIRRMITLLAENQAVAFYNDYVYAESAAIKSPLLGRAVPIARAAVSLLLKRRPLVMPLCIARPEPLDEPVRGELFAPVDLDGEDEGTAAAILGVMVECLIRRYPAAWRLWNTLEHRWSLAA